MVFGKKKEDKAETELAKLRKDHIESLKKEFRNIREIQKDIEFEVPLLTTPALAAIIHFPIEFPKRPPFIRVSPPIYHPCVTPQMTIGHPKLDNWDMRNSVPKILQDVIIQLKSTPPRFPTQQSSIYNINGAPSGGGYPPAVSNNPYPAYPPVGQMPQQPYGRPIQQSPSQQQMPNQNQPRRDRPPSVGINARLETKSYDELKALQDNPEKLEEFVKSLDDYKMKELELKEQSIMYEKSLERIIDLEPLYIRTEKEVTEKQQIAESLYREYLQNLQTLETLSKEFAPPTLVAKLRQAKSQAEEESENIAMDYLTGGDMDFELFKERFMNKRRLFHQREAKLELIKSNPSIF